MMGRLSALRRAVPFLAIGAIVLGAFLAVQESTSADHSWGNYHWARTSNPFTLKVVDSVTSQWDAYLDEAISDWSQSNVLNLEKEQGSESTRDRLRCKPISGKIRACNYTYGNNGWLGLAQIWVSDSHITQGVTKVNDTYFNTSTYNTPPWRRLVMCQEIAHDFGLAHQDETFNNANLGSCMDYTNDPDGGPGGAVENDPSNEHPNAHDYEQLETIYAHLDSTTTIKQDSGGSGGPGSRGNGGAGADIDLNDPRAWGRLVRESADKGIAVYERDLGGGVKLHTFVIRAR
jgi:hypothetical protein